MASRSARTIEEKNQQSINNKDELERVKTRCFKRRGILYVPTFSKANSTAVQYVGPGYGTNNKTHYSEMELLCMGATTCTEMLWRRGYIKNA
jgi:hypothetical protein